jgi:serine/threonine protein phosphatase PrpC
LADQNILELQHLSICRPDKQKCGDASHSGMMSINGEDCAVLIVADGVSSAPKDWLASGTTVNSVIGYLSENQSPIEKLITNAIKNANETLINGVDETTGMLSTLSVLVYNLETKKIYYANIGDSRIYGIKNGIFTKLSSDDVSSGIVKQNGKIRIVNGIPAFKTSLTKAIGGQRELDIGISVSDVNDYSGYCLVSDGFYELVLFHEYVKRIIKSVDPQQETQKTEKEIKNDMNDDASIAILVINSPEKMDVRDIILNQAVLTDISGKVFLKLVIEELNNAIDTNNHDYAESILNFMNRNDIIDSKGKMILILEKMIEKKTPNQDIIKTMIRKQY